MKTQVIVNPMAAHGKLEARWPEIEKTLKVEGMVFDVAFTEHQGHAIKLTRVALLQGYDLIVAVGGDGTLHEVVNGMFQDGVPTNPNAAVGVISAGTGSDFARTSGIPHNVVDAARHLAHTQAARAIDIGEICFTHEGHETRRYFVNVAGMGFDAEVVERTERQGKRGSGTIPYLATLISTISSYRNKDVLLRLDDRQVQARMNSVVVCNGKYFGGGMRVGPNAELQDGRFDVIIIGDMNTFEVLTNTPKIYNGTHLSHPKVSEYHAKVVRVEPQQRMMIQADGESIGPGPATFTIHPGLLRLWG